MTDSKLRKLERASASGDLEAEAKLLLERVRAGDLTEEKLRLAAYLGHEPARVALGDDTPKPTANACAWLQNDAAKFFGICTTGSPEGEWQSRYSDAEWTAGICEWGKETGIRASRAALNTLPKTETLTTGFSELIQDWLNEPSDPVSERAHKFASHALLLASDAQELPAAHCVFYAAHAISTEELSQTAGALVRCAYLAAQALGEGEAKRGQGEVRQAVQAELLPWALGLSDPLKDRVEARQREGGA